MTERTSKLLWTGLFIALALGFLWQFYPLPDAKLRVSKLPTIGNAFIGVDVPLTEFEAQIFEDVTVIKRVYTIGKYHYFVSVIDGTNNRHVVHDPYYCFTGEGERVVKSEEFPLPGGDGRLVTLEKKGETKQVLYWFSDGKHRFGSPLYYWWLTSLRRLTLGYSGAEPVLVVIQPIDKETLPWDQVIELLSPLTKI